ncbi:MAG: hypothetical protein EAZ57_08895 [Cytophagales bacterium]|nr:MAG: hypothetical protein EAZ67_09705 [Cytophagales bacterium]TAF60017.1 MAG: hypothetical protein EAZ57_08895 [Cytophagales bacterium]
MLLFRQSFRKSLFRLLFILSSTVSFCSLATAQNIATSSQYDSLKQKLSTNIQDTTRLKILLNMVIFSLVPNSNKKDDLIANMHAAQQLYNRALKRQKPSEAAFLKTYKTSFLLAEAIRVSHIGTPIETVAAFEKAELGFMQAGSDKLLHITLYSQFATYWDKIGYSNKALEYKLKALQVAEECGSVKSIIASMVNLAISYSGDDKLDIATDYYNKALKKAREVNYERALSAIFNNLSVIYLNKNKYDSAVTCARQAEVIKLKMKDSLSLHLPYINLVKAYFALGKRDSTYVILEKLKELSQMPGAEAILVDYFYLKADILRKYGKYEQALQAINMHDIYRQKYRSADVDQLKTSLQSKIRIYKAIGRYKEALACLELEQSITDSLAEQNDERKKGQLESQYEYDKKAQEQKIKEREKELIREQEKQRERWLFYAVVIALLFAIIIVVYGVYKQRQIKQASDRISMQNAELQQQREEILVINNQISNQKTGLETAFKEIEQKSMLITQGIQSANAVQVAILPPFRAFTKHFSEVMLFYKPKDIVSGDIYWFGVKENKKILAVLDCTGHGVHGAFITLIAYNLMNKIVLSKDITEPALILESLDREFIKNLKQDENHNSDGLDIALCCIQTDTSSLLFAGASMHLIEARNGYIVENKGTNRHIGGVFKNRKFKTFETIVSSLNPSSTYYLCSDGYADQHHHITKARFTRTALKNLLAEISSENLAIQEQRLEQSLNNWQLNGKQTDDITIVAFRV